MYHQVQHLTRRTMYCKRNIEALSRNHFYREKAISITYSLALVIQHAMRVRHITLSSVACLAVPHFPTLSHKSYDFWKNVIGHKTLVLIFSTTTVWNIYHSKKYSARYCLKCILAYSDLKKKNFSTAFRKLLGCQISWKSVLWKPRFSMQMDGQTWWS